MATRDAKGRWVKGHTVSEEIRRKLSESNKGRKPWNTGKKRSEKTIKKMSEYMKKRWEDPEYRKRTSEAHIGNYQTEESKQKISDTLSRMYRDGELSNSGENHPLLGTYHSEEWCRRISEAKMGHTVSDEARRKISRSVKKLWEDPEYRENMIMKQKELWKSPEYVKNQMKARKIQPNKAEIRLLGLLQQVNPAWRYVGDGSLVVDGKLPDFWDGDKGLCEHYGNYFHRGDDPQERIDFFAGHGYDCLVIWESELSDPAGVLARVESFGVV